MRGIVMELSHAKSNISGRFMSFYTKNLHSQPLDPAHPVSPGYEYSF